MLSVPHAHRICKKAIVPPGIALRPEVHKNDKSFPIRENPYLLLRQYAVPLHQELNMNEHLHSFLHLDTFKAITGADDREDALSRYVLITSTYTIEQYCHRRILKKKRFDFPAFTGDYLFPLREYPVREILAVYLSHPYKQPELVEPDFYHTIPDCSDFEDIPFCLSVSPGVRMIRGISALKIHYWAGYKTGEVCPPYGVPADLATACLELAVWNMSRIQGKKIGVTGAASWKGQTSGEHLETSMPEHVRELLEPYRRRMI
jgi:hypothetical protein